MVPKIANAGLGESHRMLLPACPWTLRAFARAGVVFWPPGSGMERGDIGWNLMRELAAAHTGDGHLIGAQAGPARHPCQPEVHRGVDKEPLRSRGPHQNDH